MHFCNDPKSKFFSVCDITNLKDIATRRYQVPYETLYFFDTAQVHNVIYFSGGGLPLTDTSSEQYFQIFMRFTIEHNMETSVLKLSGMGVPRANHTMFALTDSLLYVVGGTNLSGNLSSCEEYSAEKNKWRPVAELNETKKWVSVCGFAGRYLYAFGGVLDVKDTISDKIECLDTAETGRKTWKIVELAVGKSLWKRRFFSGTFELAGTGVMIFGGIADQEESGECLVLDPTTRALVAQEKMAIPDEFYRTKPGVSGCNLAMVGSHGGDLHVFDMAKKLWLRVEKNIWNPDAPKYKSDTF